MAKLFIYGEIGWDVSAKDITQQINDISDSEIDIHINSPGGAVTEGFAIKNILVNSGKKLRCIADGMVGSIATIIFLSSETRLMNENTKFFIHNPWGGNIGDAESMRKRADELEEAENEILDYYIKRTGADRDEIHSLMKEETSLTPERAVELGFATEIIQPVYALAYLDSKNSQNHRINTENSMNQFNEDSFINKVVSGVKNAINPIKGLKLATLAGEIMDITTSESDAGEGDAVKIAGQAPENGPIKMADGRTFNVEAGRITSIEEAPELVALDKVEEMMNKAVIKVTDLFKEENNNLKATIATQSDKINAQAEEIKNLKANISSNYQAPGDEGLPGDVPEGDGLITREDLTMSHIARAKKNGWIKN